jgi:hypothetical protein
VYRRGVQQEARAEAAQAGGRAFELGQTFYTAPLLSMLGGAPTSLHGWAAASGPWAGCDWAQERHNFTTLEPR